MRKSYFLFVLLLLTRMLTGQLSGPQPTAIDQNTSKLTVKALVIDRDLNAKPIPKFV